MKNIISGIIFFFLALFIYTKATGPFQLSVNSVSTNKSDNFTVTGEGKVTVSPDIAMVNAGVTAQSSSAKAAQDKLNQNINAVIDSVKKLGIDAKDIKTTNYNINPQYDFREGKKITGYEANANLMIKVRQIDKANSVVDAATGAGANQVGGISFEIDDKTKAQNEARQIAVDQAKKTAQEAARIAGFTLGRVVNYSESFGGGFPGITLMKAEVMDRAGGVPTQLEPGTNEIAVTVSLSYEIR